MSDMKHLLSHARRAVDDYGMIQGGDKIAVGISGGKDSLTLLSVLAALRRFYPAHFDLVAITVGVGFPGMDFSGVAALCRDLDVPYITVHTQIADIVFGTRKEKNPCSLCAKMRRGALHAAAVEAGCNKVALGHHYDDAVETFMMNLVFEGRIGCFSPVTYLSNRKITLIRPLLYAKEKDIVGFTKKVSLPVVKSTCPEDHATEREYMKNHLHEFEKIYPDLKERIFHAMRKGNIDGFHL